MCVQESPVEIQTATCWNPIGHSMITQKAILSTSSILLPPHVSCLHFHKEKFSAQFKNFISVFFVPFMQLLESETAQVWECLH